MNPGGQNSATNSNQHIYTPLELLREVRLHIEAGFPRVLLEAEISNLSRPASGHLYFTLKDEKAQIRCALFKSSAARLMIKPENGIKVLARGRISLYEARGDFQMIVDGLQHAGEGLLRQQFEALKKKLESEGLFDTQLKKPLPPIPLKIGVITSPSGAAIRDVLNVLKRRWPLAQVRIYGVPVQGEDAPPAIVAALENAGNQKWADVLILCRGGGSLEDLWAFNDENVARSIHTSTIPLISAVGHETDFTIADFVADLRAPTPSAAAELATPDSQTMKTRFSRIQRQLHQRATQQLHRLAQQADHMTHRLGQCHPNRQLLEQRRRLINVSAPLHRNMLRMIGERQSELGFNRARLLQAHPARRVSEHLNEVKALKTGLQRAATRTLRNGRDQLASLARTLQAVSPLQTIARGYAVILDPETEGAIASIEQLKQDDPVIAQLSDGRAYCHVEKLSPESLDVESAD
jgi:exodeoxyribonuclease VII large subunit